MKIVHINQSDLDGGAALAGYRLHSALVSAGVHSRMIVGSKKSIDPNIQESSRPSILERLNFKIKRFVYPPYLAFPWGAKLAHHPWVQEADIVHVHNLHTGYVASLRSLPAIAGGKPIVITLHDMWHFTGHCSYSESCTKWKSGCGECPLLEVYPAITRDTTRLEWRIKRQATKTVMPMVIAPSRWMQRCAEASLLGDMNIEHIPYPLDTELYKPLPMHVARGRLGLPESKKVLLIAAATLSEKRKGFDLFVTAFNRLHPNQRKQTVVLVMGRNEVAEAIQTDVVNLGYISSDEDKALVYSSADLLAFPSLEDNLPLTLMEAAACGLPAVAYPRGGIPEIVEHGKTGWLAEEVSADCFSTRLREALSLDAESSGALRAVCRERAVAHYRAPAVAECHRLAYEKALRNSARNSDLPKDTGKDTLSQLV